MSLLSGVHNADYLAFGLPSGTAAQMSVALQIAWEQTEEFIGTTLRPVSYTDEYHPWPHNGVLALNHPKLITVDALTARHDLQDCDCDTNDYSGCELVSNYDLGIIIVRDCHIASTCVTCAAPNTGRPKWAIVDYTAGYALGSLTTSEKYAICLLASVWLEQQSGDLELGAPGAVSWGSLSYRESRMKPRESELGRNYRASQAFDLLRHLRVKRSPRWNDVRSSRVF